MLLPALLAAPVQGGLPFLDIGPTWWQGLSSHHLLPALPSG